MRCESNPVLTTVEHHELRCEEDIAEDVDALTIVRLDTAEAVYSLQKKSVHVP